MRYAIALILVLTAQSCTKHDMDTEGLAEDVLKRKEGIRIEIDPVEEKK
jgi:hypothetical protein